MPSVQQALAYASAGFPVFPLNGKVPYEKAGAIGVEGQVIPEGASGFHRATVDPERIELWWQQWPDANIGTPTGRHTDAVLGRANVKPFDVLDVDTDHDGLTSLDALITEHSELPDTAMQVTGTGGLHYCFTSSGEIRNSAGGIATGIDVRGTGGYIVVAPSVHPETLEPYLWADGQSILELELATIPEWLLDLIIKVTRRRASIEPGARIPLGVQEATLMRIAGAMRRQSATESEILAALRVVSQERCDPAVADRDLIRMAASAARYTPADVMLSQQLNDEGNAVRFIERYGEAIRYERRSKLWYVWQGSHWYEDEGLVRLWALDTVKAMRETFEAHPDEDDDIQTSRLKWAKASGSASKINSMVEVSSWQEGIAITPEVFDHDPWLMTVANGTLDLRTGELREHNANDLITRYSSVEYDPDASSELWESYLEGFTKGNRELADFLQMAAGYTATGLTQEDRLIFLHGPAATGKTTFIEALKAAYGSYAMTADFETFLKRRDVGGPRPDIARLAGARFVSSVEVESGKALAEGLVKQMTGGDKVTARFLYGKEFEFTPTHKLWLVANDAPKVSDEDDGLWRRILRVPCDAVVPPEKRDPLLKQRLKDPIESGPAILKWVVEGAIKWRNAGRLFIPEVIEAATRDYRESQDPMTDFLAESAELDPTYRVEFADLWQAYLGYCKQYRRKPMGKQKFGERLDARGHGSLRSNGKRFVSGLTLASSEF